MPSRRRRPLRGAVEVAVLLALLSVRVARPEHRPRGSRRGGRPGRPHPRVRRLAAPMRPSSNSPLKELARRADK